MLEVGVLEVGRLTRLRSVLGISEVRVVRLEYSRMSRKGIRP